MAANRKISTLWTSPISMADFILRLAFFSVAPIAIVFAAELFPVRGALLDVGLALGVFVASEVVQRWSSKVKLIKSLLRDALAFETYYRSRHPRPFLYYLAYPFLFPYWTINREARREFLVYRSYNLGGLLILIVVLIWQYVFYWAPDLTIRQFLPYVAISLCVEMVLVMALLMPIATTVVWYHSSFRRGRLLVVLLVALLSTAFAITRVATRRSPLVSYAARERVVLRTKVSKRKAHEALVASVRAAYKAIAPRSDVEGDGNVMGDPLDAAHDALETYYKRDEASAFKLWASPRTQPKVLVLYFEARRQHRPIWVAIRNDGSEIRSPSQLPKGAFKAMRAIGQADDDWLVMWPEMIDYSGDAAPGASGHRGRTNARKAAAPSIAQATASAYLHEPHRADASVQGAEVSDAGK